MEKVIAVAENLSALRDALIAHGYDVVGLEGKDLERAAAVVITGVDKEMMGMEDIQTKVPVINAAGKSSNEVVNDIDTYFQQIH